ncbi:fumarylacetoacetate hydrolase family protein [Streptomyces sp. MMG1533]|uniref:fumarylacetoacetate hydrolase family protein n=1 Tax=Streptomyces sp. MMG1533 TaxID=1415546 RepID=UPI00099C787C
MDCWLSRNSVAPWRRGRGGRPGPGKSAPPEGLSGAAAFGPWLLTPDEFLGTAEQELLARINGRTVLRHPVQPLAERLWELLAHCSSWTDLEPGDVLAVSTPDVPGPEAAAVCAGDVCAGDVCAGDSAKSNCRRSECS